MVHEVRSEINLKVNDAFNHEMNKKLLVAISVLLIAGIGLSVIFIFGHRERNEENGSSPTEVAKNATESRPVWIVSDEDYTVNSEWRHRISVSEFSKEGKYMGVFTAYDVFVYQELNNPCNKEGTAGVDPSGNIYIHNPTDCTYTKISPAGKLEETATSEVLMESEQKINNSAMDEYGNIWMVNPDLNKLEEKKFIGQTTTPSLKSDILCGNDHLNVYKIISDRAKDLWILCSDNLTNNDNNATLVKLSPYDKSIDRYYIGGTVLSYYPDNTGNIWALREESDGISLVKIDAGTVNDVVKNIDTYGYRGSYILGVDSSDNIWVAGTKVLLFSPTGDLINYSSEMPHRSSIVFIYNNQDGEYKPNTSIILPEG